MGLALATKYSGVVVLIAASAALLARAVVSGELRAWWSPADPTISRGRALLAAAGNIALLGGIAIVVVRAATVGEGYGPYWDGLRAQIAHQSAGHPAYLLGEISRSGWTSYFPIAIAVKEPPLTLVLVAVSFAMARVGAPVSRSLAVACVPLFVLAASLLLVRVDIGVRYALPIVPLLVVLAARVATIPAPAWLRAGLAIGFVHHAIAAARVAPHDLAFFSDVIGGPSRGHLYLADSNLDWGQDVRALGQWLGSHERPRRLYFSYFGASPPEAYGVTYVPAPTSSPHPSPWTGTTTTTAPSQGRELLAISAMNVQGVFFDDPRAYAWLAERRPVALLGWTIAIYDITDDATAHRELARLYERYGPREFAADERARADSIGDRETQP